jgi:alanine-glyoxylate transaminase/(R)-3-amino-2-methylpropionate-pyruvate transaminase
LQNWGCLSLLRRTFAAEPAHEKALPELPPFSYQPQPYTGPSKEEVLALRKKFLSPCELGLCRGCWLSRGMYCSCTDKALEHHAGLFHHFKDPVMITEGKMQYLFDEKGRRYLDVSS